MEKYDNIKEYCEENMMTVSDLKEMILDSALRLGCNAKLNFDEDLNETVQVFNTLYFFNDILDTVV